VEAARYGDLGDLDSAVSKLVAGRQGYELMPEMGYRPTNRYLPPRPRHGGLEARDAAPSGESGIEPESKILAWVDRVLSR